jgi:copper chaperone CopZ
MSDNQQENARKMRELAGEIEAMIHNLTGQKEWSLLETDLLKQHLRDLYQLVSGQSNPTLPNHSTATKTMNMAEEISHLLVQQLRNRNAADTVPSVPVADLNREETMHIEEEKKEVTEQIQIPDQPVSSAEVIVKAKTETVVIEPTQTKQKEVHSKNIRSASSLFEEPETLARQYQPGERVSDKLSKNQTSTRLSETFSAKGHPDLKQAIGINERFAFINELFAGDAQLFYDSIETINRAGAYEDAHNLIFDDFASRYAWKKDSARVLELDELVRRRFSV